MRLAFVTGALASGVVGAVLAVGLVWVLTLVTGSGELWGAAPIVVGIVSIVLAAATYVAERSAYRREVAPRAAKGEPWAYRQ